MNFVDAKQVWFGAGSIQVDRPYGWRSGKPNQLQFVGNKLLLTMLQGIQ